MKKTVALALTGAFVLVGATAAQAAGRTEAINACKAAIDAEIGVEDINKKMTRIKDKGSRVLLTFRIRYGDVSQTAKCLAHDSGEIIDLTIS